METKTQGTMHNSKMGHPGQARESAYRPKLTKYGPNRDRFGLGK